jgi:hypothetical protein
MRIVIIPFNRNINFVNSWLSCFGIWKKIGNKVNLKTDRIPNKRPNAVSCKLQKTLHVVAPSPAFASPGNTNPSLVSYCPAFPGMNVTAPLPIPTSCRNWAGNASWCMEWLSARNMEETQSNLSIRRTALSFCYKSSRMHTHLMINKMHGCWTFPQASGDFCNE